MNDRSSPVVGVSERLFRAPLLWLASQRTAAIAARRLPVLGGLASRFVAGETMADALAALDRLRETGARTTVDLLGESVTSFLQARETADNYISLIHALAQRNLDPNVSLKLTALGLDVDPEACAREFGRVLNAAESTRAFVRIDMEDHRYTDRTLALARTAFRGYANVGVVIQACLRRSESDVARLIEERIPVRLCKGAYAEPADVAYPNKADVDAAYVRMLDRLVLSGGRVGIATHDPVIIDHAQKLLRRSPSGSAQDNVEFQMLYGIRRDLQRELVMRGYGLRVYVPYGPQWFPYLMRRLAERPANVAFLLGSVTKERFS
jgi:proline dehydrogenase